MANKIEIDVKVDDKGTTRKVGLEAKKTAGQLDGVAKSSSEVDRNMKGAANATSNSTKSFAKMSQGMGGLVSVYATIAAQVFAVSAAFQFLKDASDTANLIAGQKALGTVTGVAYGSLTKSIRAATDAQLSYREAAQAASIGTAAGLSGQQLSDLARAAKNTSQILGRDLTDSFNRLVRGVTKAEPELLDELGIILRLDTAKQKYAQTIGKTADQLDEFERSQAVANEVLSQAEKKFGAMESLMDPSAASLNRFITSFDELLNSIKSISIDALRPVFDFLSNNTAALSAAFGLMALQVTKAILPSFSTWKQTSAQNLAAQRADLDAYNLKIKETEDALAKLTAAQKLSRDEAISLAKTTLGTKAPGADTKVTQTGFDFITGRSDKDKAAANMEKILKGAEKQLENSQVVMTGKLKDFNAKQVADLRQSYEARKAIVSEFEQHSASSWEKIKTHSRLKKLQVASVFQSAEVMVTRFTGVLVTAFNWLGRIAFWVGVITTLVQVGTAVWEKFFPPDEKVKKAEAAISSFKDRMSDLNEELERTAAYKGSTLFEELSQAVIATGNAVKSSNIITELTQFERLDPNAEGWEEAKTQIVKTLDVLGQLDSRYKPYIAVLKENNKLTIDQKRNIADLTKELIKQSEATTQLPRTMQSIQDQLTKMSGGNKNPLGELINTLDIAKEQAKERLEGLNREYSEAGKRREAILKNIAEMEKKQITAGFKGTQGKRFLDIEDTKAYAKLKEDLKAINRSMESYTDQTVEAMGADEERNKLADIFSQHQADHTQAIKDQSKYKLDYAKNQQYGNSLAAQEANLANEINQEKARTAALDQKRIEATIALEVALEKSKGEETALVTLRREGLAVAKNNLDIDKETNRLAADRRLDRQIELKYLKEMEAIKDRELANSIKQARITREQSSLPSTSFGMAGGAASANLEYQGLLTQREINATNYTKALQKVLEAEDKLFAGTGSWEALDAAERDLAKIREISTKNTEQDIVNFNSRGQAALNEARGTTELAQARLAAASVNPMEEAFLNKVYELRTKGTTLTDEQLKLMREEYRAQQDLNDMYELKKGIFSSMTDNISGAFSALVQGTKSAKEAFKDMAVAILSDIAQMITKMLVMRLLFSFMPGFSGMMMPMPAVPAARVGGVFSEGKKVQGYSTGGVAQGPRQGFPAVLHGTEAVVPLPNGRSIPVEMTGNSNSNNNVVVNVNMSEGSARQETQQGNTKMSKELGRAIANAVQQELQNQKRSGGILNPYGVA